MLWALLACAVTVWGATYDVNPGGNWNAYKSSLQPGDILTLHPQTPGQPYTYTLTGSNSFTLIGSPSLPIIVQGAPGEKVTMAMNADQNVIELKGKYFLFQNIWLTALSGAPGAIGLRLLPNTSHATIRKVTVFNVPETAFTANTDHGYYDNVTFDRCEAYDTGGTGECFYVGCQPAGGVTTFKCQFVNGALTNNYCHDTCTIGGGCTGGSLGSGYQVKGWGSYNNVVRNNVCVRVNQVCILLYDDYDLGPNIVEGNWVYGSVEDAGIQVSAGAIIRNNVVVGNVGGIVVTANSANLAPGKSNRNLVISGNTFVNNGVGIEIPQLTAGSRIVNNAFIEDSGQAFANNVAPQSGVTWSKNAWHGGTAPITGQISVGASSTLFQNVASYNFHPKAASLLASGAALTAADSTVDFACVARMSANPSIGAYEQAAGSALSLGFQEPCSVTVTTSTPTPMPSAGVTSAPTRTPTTPAPTLACAGINCGSHGACTEPNPVCVCTDGYTGSRCGTPPVDPCVGPPAVNCGAHGSCAAGVCTCIDGYTGTLCATPPPPTCTDGIRNSDETAIDCGGTVAQCPPCPTFFWSPNDWTNCSKTCGSGTHTRSIACIATLTGMATTPDKCTGVHTFTTVESCNEDACATYSWQTEPFDTCSAPCGTGFQTRVVKCVSSAGNVTVDPMFCIAGDMPVARQNCNTNPCVAPHWVTGGWSECTLPCGGGLQNRTRRCFDAQENPVSADLCPSPAPTIEQPCNTEACVNYYWKACPTFYPCTAQCNGGGAMVGNQYRDVFCRRDTDEQAVDPALCDNATKPATLLSVCNTQPCSTYNWMADSNFGPCVLQPSGIYQRFRTFHCHAADGNVATKKDCELYAGKLPIGVLPCTLGTCASPDGCPIVEIADVFNQCDKNMLLVCSATSECAAAANLLELQLRTLMITSTNAQKCVNDYVTSLAVNDRPTQDLVTYVTTNVLAGSPLCVVSGVLNVVPSVFLLATLCFSVAMTSY